MHRVTAELLIQTHSSRIRCRRFYNRLSGNLQSPLIAISLCTFMVNTAYKIYFKQKTSSFKLGDCEKQTGGWGGVCEGVFNLHAVSVEGGGSCYAHPLPSRSGADWVAVIFRKHVRISSHTERAIWGGQRKGEGSETGYFLTCSATWRQRNRNGHMHISAHRNTRVHVCACGGACIFVLSCWKDNEWWLRECLLPVHSVSL